MSACPTLALLDIDWVGEGVARTDVVLFFWERWMICEQGGKRGRMEDVEDGDEGGDPEEMWGLV